jgi:uncharacterized protein YcbK (DUF882 family)
MTISFFKRDNATEHNVQRRRLLQMGLATSAGLFVPNAFSATLSQPERTLSFKNLHTGEELTATYWAEGQYQAGEIKAINRVLRDHRTGDIYGMDSLLLETLNILHYKMEGKSPFHVISGYRSPKTNAMLSQKSNGVAKKSYHMQGKAIDIRLPGRELCDLHKMALSLKAGGVGYYSKSDFIHLDTGRVRSWGA